MTQEEGLQKKRAYLTMWDTEQKDSRARRMLEIESAELAGQGFPPPISPDRIPSNEKLEYLRLDASMNRIWNEARMSYVYGFFQSSVFQIGAVAELLIEQTLRVKGKWSDYASKYPSRRRWLGTLIGYCEDEHIVATETLKDLSDINDLRIAAVHMETEKEEVRTAPDENPLVELEDTSVYEGDQVRGKPTLPGQSIMIGVSNEKPVIKEALMYKPQAAEAFGILSRVFPAMRKLQI
jgi:hypothetical protein